jgi:uncharacterized protein (DUF2147 family)
MSGMRKRHAAAGFSMMPYLQRMMIGLFFISPALACPADQAPEGEWRVKDGNAYIRIAACNKKLWGVISWVQDPDTDKHNPDAARRDRPVLGIPVLLGLQPEKSGRWLGDIYNADNGKIYKGSVRLKSENVLRVEGCVLHGLICGGEDWTRLETPPVSRKARDSVCEQPDIS